MKKTTELKRKSNAKYIQNSNNKVKAIWEIINSETKKVNSEKNDESSSLSANDLNDYFCEIGRQIAGSTDSRCSPHDLLHNCRVNNAHSFFFAPITADEICNILKTLKSKNTKDIYEISTNLLKQVSNEISTPLAIIFNKCVEQGIFPSLLKKGKILPIFKKGDKAECENYRPISILPALSKIFEQAIAARLANYLEKNKYLSPKQHGYKKGCSTTTGICSMVRQIYDAFDTGMCSEMNTLDLTKAFDSVSHGLLLSKLEYYGIRQEQHNLFRSYLSGRTQLTEWNSTRSDVKTNVEYGVPQGSILGPLLFVVYINDLPSNIKYADICLYADDTSLLVKARNTGELQHRSEIAIKTASDWFAANGLKINQDKTQKITFTTTKAIPAEVKFLGVTLDSNMKWHRHTDELASRLSSSLYAIKRVKHIATHEATKMAYYSYFHTLLCYGVLFWGASTGAHRIFVLQKRAIRFICNLEPTQSCRTYFKSENILTLPAIYILSAICYIHNNKQLFPDNGQYHDYPTRCRMNVRVPYHRLTRTQRDVDYWGTKLYNCLPDNVKALPTSGFRRQAKQLLLDAECYAIEDFLNV